MPRYLGLNEMVEELALKMKLTRFERDRINQPNIVERLAQTSQQYLAEVLGGQRIKYDIWREIAGPLADGIRTVLVLGNTFVPNFVIDVAGKPQPNPSVAARYENTRFSAANSGLASHSFLPINRTINALQRGFLGRSRRLYHW